MDDLAQLKNNQEINTEKIKILTHEKQQLIVELAKYQREMAARKEFSSMITELEESGENYLELMRNVKCFISKAPTDNYPSKAKREDR